MSPQRTSVFALLSVALGAGHAISSDAPLRFRGLATGALRVVEPFAGRQKRAYDRLGADVLIIRSVTSPAAASSMGFRQDANFFYFTGVTTAFGAVLVLDGERKRAELFLPAQLSGATRFVAPRQPPADRAVADSFHVDGVSDWTAFAKYIDTRLASRPGVVLRVDDGGDNGPGAGTLGTPLDSTTPLENAAVAWRRQIERRWPQATVRPDREVTTQVRAIKDAAEIAALRRVADASAQAMRAALPRFTPGRRQREVESAVVETCTRLGDGPSFWPWVMSGPNAVFPTAFASLADAHNLDRVMRAGEVVRLDIGCAVDQYMGDVGRTVPVTGKFSPGQAETIDLLVAAYRAGLAMMRDGASLSAVVHASIDEVARRQPSLRTPLAREAAATITRPRGIPFWQIHGIGLDVAEQLTDTLRAGMVLDYEPIFSAGDQGFYMEDMILVTRDGHEVLTKGLPYSAADIERAMRRR